jgi:hypothetical protein
MTQKKTKKTDSKNAPLLRAGRLMNLNALKKRALATKPARTVKTRGTIKKAKQRAARTARKGIKK